MAQDDGRDADTQCHRCAQRRVASPAGAHPDFHGRRSLASIIRLQETLPAPHLCVGGDLKASPRGVQDATRPLRDVLPVDTMRRLTEMAMGALFNLSGHALSPALVAPLASSAQEVDADADAESVRQTTVRGVVQQSSTLAAVYRVLPCVIDVKELVSRQSRYG